MLNNKIIKICEQKFIYFNYSKNTSDCYISYIKQFIYYIGDRQIIHCNSNDFQNYLYNYNFTSISQQNQVINAIKFLYDLNKNNYLGIDLGLNNLCTLTSNKIGFNPIIINGRPIKSINQYYNKTKSKLQSKLPLNVYTSNRIERLTIKRNNKIKDYIHNQTKKIVNICILNDIGTIVIGYNKGWKDEINLGTITNQKFVNIPFLMIVNQLKYKAKLAGIDVIIQEESYTSKSSFLDNDTIPIYNIKIKNEIIFSGKRICRGMYKSKNGILINSDVNGSYNIIKKAFPKAFANGIEDVAVHPMKLKNFIKK